MTKRAAMLMAAGVVMALLGGAMALSFGLSGTSAAADTGTRPEPRVRTITRTVRIEKEAKPSDQPVQVITLDAASTTSSDPVEDADQDDSYDGDDSYEDDSYEDEDHEDDGDDEDEDHEDDGDGEEDEPEDD